MNEELPMIKYKKNSTEKYKIYNILRSDAFWSPLTLLQRRQNLKTNEPSISSQEQRFVHKQMLRSLIEKLLENINCKFSETLFPYLAKTQLRL